MTHHETLLAILPGASETERLVIAMKDFSGAGRASPLQIHGNDAPTRSIQPRCCQNCPGSADRPIVMRQESFSVAVGWFAQSCVELTIAQWSLMRTTIAPAALQPRQAVPRSWNDDEDEVAVLPFDPKRAVSA